MPVIYSVNRLVRAIQRGNHAAFTYLVQRTQTQLVAYAASLIPPTISPEDIVQDVYARLWQHRKQWTPTGSIHGYLRRSVRNRALGVMRREQRGHVIVNQLPHPRAPDPADYRVLFHEVETIFLDIVRQLPMRQRNAYLWCSILKWPHAKVARMLGVSAGTVNYYLVHARKIVLEGLLKHGITLPKRFVDPEMIFFRDT